MTCRGTRRALNSGWDEFTVTVQAHDPVVIVNLVAGETREGRVLKTLLDKLELDPEATAVG